MTRAMAMVCAAALAACGASGEADVGTDIVPEGDGAFLSVTFLGSEVPFDRLIAIPDYVLNTDGQLFFEVPISESDPGPLLPSIRVSTVPDDRFQEVAQLIDEIGFGDFDEKSTEPPADPLNDATTAVFSVYDSTGAHTYTVHAFGVDQGDPDTALLAEIIRILNGASAGDSAPYRGDRLQVLAGALLGIFADSLTTQAPWPLDIEFADMTDWALDQRCTVLEGEAAAKASALFAEADEGYEWGPDRLRIRARPLLPGEEGCAEAPEHLRNAPPPTAPPTTTDDLPPPGSDEAEAFEFDAPPTVTVLGTTALELYPFTYCWDQGNESGCADGAEPDPLPHAGAFDDPVPFTFPLSEWVFTATMTSIDGVSGGPTPVRRLDEGMWAIDLSGGAGPAMVSLSGSGPSGSIAVAFALDLVVAGAEPDPVVDFAAFFGELDGSSRDLAPNRLAEAEVRTTGFGLYLAHLATDVDPQASVRVVAANGAEGEVVLGEHQDGPDPEGNGVVSLYSTLAEAEDMLALGDPPYRFILDVVISGVTHTASFAYPDDLDLESTSFRPIFEPPLPGRND